MRPWGGWQAARLLCILAYFCSCSRSEIFSAGVPKLASGPAATLASTSQNPSELMEEAMAKLQQLDQEFSSTYGSAEGSGSGDCTWVYSGWTCDVACGEGNATRSASCVSAITHQEAMDPSCCYGPPAEPLASSCNRGQCPHMAWLAGQWGECNTKCGGGIALRKVMCVNSMNEVMDDSVCASGGLVAAADRPSTWKTCNTAPCPLLMISDADKQAAVQDMVESSVSKPLGISGTIAGKPAKPDLLSLGAKPETRKPSMDGIPWRGGVTIMSGPASAATSSDEAGQSTSEDSGPRADQDAGSSEDAEPSSDDGNGSEYVRKSLKELLVCYRDSDCGPGYKCEPFSCAKACSVYTDRQTVSRDLRERYLPDPPSFVYQKMYQTIIFRGIGGICYRKCHHMTRCTRQNRDGTCADWFCRKVEGCHNYPGDYHVPSLEECGVNGLCKPGKCYRSFANRVTGDSLPEAPLDSEDDVTDPNACPARTIPSLTGCCPSGVISSDGACCPTGSSVDKDGACCPSENLDACGICGGDAHTVDILGQCCSTALDGNGVCCRSPKKVDECGICGGWNSSCALTPSYSARAATMSEVEQILNLQLPRQLSQVAEDVGFNANSMEVEQLTVDSLGEETGMVEASFTYNIFSNAMRKDLSIASFVEKTEEIRMAQLTTIKRTGICGNSMCEVGEQTRDDSEGSCMEDCSWSAFIPCACSGHGVCSAATGSCTCHQGYTGPMCAFCDEGYISVGDDADEGYGRALCIPGRLAGNLSTSTTFDLGIMQSIGESPDTIGLKEAQMASSSANAGASRTPAVAAMLIILVLVLTLAAVSIYMAARIHKRSRNPAGAETQIPQPGNEVIMWSPTSPITISGDDSGGNESAATNTANSARDTFNIYATH